MSPICPPLPVMWCSAAVDVLFLIDGSHSIGKGSFERAKHFAITVCDALDVNPERVSASLAVFVFRVSLVLCDRNPVLSKRGHLLACGSGKTKAANHGCGRGRAQGLSPSLLSVFLTTVGFLLRQVFHTQQSCPALSFKLVTPVKRKWTFSPSSGRKSPREGSDWAGVGHMTIP